MKFIICMLFGHKFLGDFPKLPVRFPKEKEYAAHKRCSRCGKIVRVGSWYAA